MTDEVQIRPWTVLTCPKGHPLYITIRPLIRGKCPEPGWVTKLNDETGAWDCPCGRRGFVNTESINRWGFYVKGKLVK